MNFLLTKASRIFKTDIHYIFRGGSLLTITQITSAVISFFLTLAFANLIPQETYGTYKYLLSLYALFAIATFPGIDTAVIQSASHGHDGAMMQGFRAKIKLGLLATLAALLYAVYSYIIGHQEVAYLCMIMALALPVMEASTVGVSFFNAKRLYRVWTINDVVTQIVSALIMFGTIFVTKNIFFIALAYFVPTIIARLITVFFISKKFVHDSKEDPGMMHYGRSMTLFQVITRIIGSLDQIVLFHFLGPAQVAIFSLAQSIPSRIQSVLKILGTLALPKYAHRSTSEIAKNLIRKMYMLTGIIVFGCLVYVAIAPWFFTHFLPKYIDSIKYSQVLIFYCISAITYPFGSLLLSHKKIRENYIVSISGIIAKVLAMLIFIPLYGVWGAIIGILVSSGTTTLISLWLLYKAQKGDLNTPTSTNIDNGLSDQSTASLSQ